MEFGITWTVDARGEDLYRLFDTARQCEVGPNFSTRVEAEEYAEYLELRRNSY